MIGEWNIPLPNPNRFFFDHFYYKKYYHFDHLIYIKEKDEYNMIIDVTAIMEASSVKKNSDYAIVTLNGKQYKASIKCKKEYNEILLKNLKSTIKIMNSKSLYDYLYNYYKDMFDEMNEYGDCSIESGSDIVKAIYGIDLITIEHDTVYVSGYCEWDEEHGFSIGFPNGKFVKNTSNNTDHKNDIDKENKYQPRYTIFSGHRSAY